MAPPVNRVLRRSLQSTWGVLVALSAVCGGGCAPLLHKPAGEYATVQADPQHDTEEARRQYRRALAYIDKYLCGRRPELNLGKAEGHLHDALVADVRFGPAHNALGLIYYYRQQLYLAAWEFEYAAKLMPDLAEPLNNLGLVYEAAGKLDQAIYYYAQARELAPTQPDAIANLARASLRNGQSVDQVRDVLDDIIAVDTRPEWREWASEQLGLHPPTERLTRAPESLPSPVPEPQPLETNSNRNGTDGPVLPMGLQSEDDLTRLRQPIEADRIEPVSREDM